MEFLCSERLGRGAVFECSLLSLGTILYQYIICHYTSYLLLLLLKNYWSSYRSPLKLSCWILWKELGPPETPTEASLAICVYFLLICPSIEYLGKPAASHIHVGRTSDSQAGTWKVLLFEGRASKPLLRSMAGQLHKMLAENHRGTGAEGDWRGL